MDGHFDTGLLTDGDNAFQKILKVCSQLVAVNALVLLHDAAQFRKAVRLPAGKHKAV